MKFELSLIKLIEFYYLCKYEQLPFCHMWICSLFFFLPSVHTACLLYNLFELELVLPAATLIISSSRLSSWFPATRPRNFTGAKQPGQGRAGTRPEGSWKEPPSGADTLPWSFLTLIAPLGQSPQPLCQRRRWVGMGGVGGVGGRKRFSPHLTEYIMRG